MGLEVEQIQQQQQQEQRQVHPDKASHISRMAHVEMNNPSTSNPAPAPKAIATPAEDARAVHTWRFWAILISLSLTGMMSAIEGTIITSALPTIIADLGGGDAYIWVPNAFLLSSVAVLPLYAQMSNVFGRRWPLLLAVVLFTLGSGLSGGANSMTMLIAARTVQGLGGGGINLLLETVVTDLVPLKERGKYMALVELGATVGVSLGPFLGGVITSKSSWRWCFYINVPIGGLVFIALYIFLRVNYQKTHTWLQRVARIDFYGNAIFIAAIVSTLIALTWGGTVYKWDGFHILVPLILGFIGLGLFIAFEWTPKLCPEPSVPRKLVSNRTSAAVLVLTFIRTILAFWGYYFLPVYFQGVRGESPFMSGVDTLPIFGGGLFFVIVGGITLSTFGRYKPMHFGGFAAAILGLGLFTLLDANSSTAACICYQLVFAAGTGIISGILLPAMQAPLDESLVATATGLWSFVRYFGCIWGVTIPSAIFNNECKRLAHTVSHSKVSAMLRGGQAYQFATKAFLDSISDDGLKAQVKDVFARALRMSWFVAIAFAGVGLLTVFAEREIKLRETLDSEFGIEEKERRQEDGAIALDAVQTVQAVSATDVEVSVDAMKIESKPS